MEERKYCIYCGTVMPKDQERCPDCGKKQDGKENLFKEYLWKHTKEKIRGDIDDSLFEIVKNWLISHLYGLVLLLTVVGSAAYVFSNRPPARTAYIGIEERPSTGSEASVPADDISEADLENLRDAVYGTVDQYQNAVFYWTIENDPYAGWGPNGYQNEIPERPETFLLPAEYGTGKHEYIYDKGLEEWDYSIDRDSIVLNEPTTELGKSLMAEGYTVGEIIKHDVVSISNGDGTSYAGPGEYLFVIVEIDGVWYVAEDFVV